ncbi:MAG: hypothetical protein AAGF88_04500 [Pseudomonadota bacterium]
MIRSLMVILCLAGPAAAQVEFGYHDSLTTRFGQLVVIGEPPSQQLAFNGTIVPGLENWSIAIHGAWGLAEPAVDWVVIHSHNGGNACDPPRHILRISSEGYSVSPAFADCIYSVQDIRVFPDRIELDMPHGDIAIESQTFIYDGTTLSARIDAPALGAGDPTVSDARRWLGQHPYRVFEDSAEQARFLRIMSDTEMRNLAGQMSGPGDGAILRDGWVLGAACMAHQCNIHAGAWGIRLSDGAAASAILANGIAPVVYGAAFDPVFQAWLSEQAF